MNRIGTDVVALAAILGSAAVGGVVTLAALDRGQEPNVADCLAATAVPAPRVIVESHTQHGDASRTIVMVPRLHVRATHGCAVVVDRSVQVELDRARAQLDKSRVKLEQLYEQDLERRINEEMARLERELARLSDEAGR